MEWNVALTSKVAHTGVVEFFEHISSATKVKCYQYCKFYLHRECTISVAHQNNTIVTKY